MSHLALYRKYRPETFGDVIGQDAVVDALKASLRSGKVSHAYLFAGSRGTGKTSVARIFARELGTSPNDTYEIDAASNNGVDEIRELRDGVTTLPFESKYKVYILDEVHMLSKAAFNALLKTLEEPPAHVIFILATTELHKVLDTVKSRCQVFEFKKPTLNTLTKFVEDGVRKEGKTITEDAAELIALHGFGAYRDTWGIIERIVQSTKGKEIGLKDVELIIATPNHELVSDFVSAIVSRNLDAALEILNECSQSYSVDHLLEDTLKTCRLVLLYRFAPTFAETATGDLSDDAKSQIKTWASEKNAINANLVVEFLHLLDEVKKSSIPSIPVELALIRILTSE